MTTQRPLQKMFSAVPPRYDFVNRVITWQLDRLWRSHAAKACFENAPRKILDLCCGTGDLTDKLAKLAPAGSSLVGLDFSATMLSVARRKSLERQGERSTGFILGDVGELPFADAAFDAVGIAFAFRNLTFENPKTGAYLKELLRILAPGGRCVIVESSQPSLGWMRAAYHLYLKVLVAQVGGLISGQRDAYRYLAHSASNYYPPQELKDLLLNAGFSSVSHRGLSLGVAAIHVAHV